MPRAGGTSPTRMNTATCLYSHDATALWLCRAGDSVHALAMLAPWHPRGNVSVPSVALPPPPAEPAASKRQLEEMRVHLREEFFGEMDNLRAELERLSAGRFPC